jgi:hypothetical protein
MSGPGTPELVVQSNGQVRQAGATAADSAFIQSFRLQAERSLFTFAVGILGYTFLTQALHRPVCDWLQKVPPQRKMLLMPRDHGKSTLVPRTLPLHMWIQPADTNRYFPGVPGGHTRVLLAGESYDMAKGNLRVVKSHMEGNDLLRGLWPHVCWENPRRDAKTWNDGEIIIKRDVEFAEASLDAVGVGGARTGKHPNVIIKDDITTEAAANSSVVMQTAIDWHVNSRALLPPNGLEFITGTYWTPDDMPHYVEKDPSVAVNRRFRAVTERGSLIWPEYVTADKVDQWMKEYGPRFNLLYMNRVVSGDLIDFNRADLRMFDIEGDAFEFTEDYRDEEIAKTQFTVPTFGTADQPDFRGRRLTDPDVQENLRKFAFRARVT